MQHFARFQLTARSRGPSATAGLLVLDGANTSDHLAILWQMNVARPVTKTQTFHIDQMKLDWKTGDTAAYRCALSNYLSRITLPIDTLNCNGSGCASHCYHLESYYALLVEAMHSAAKLAIPMVKAAGFHKHWSTPQLDDLKRQCMDATELWRANGIPRSGEINVTDVA